MTNVQRQWAFDYKWECDIRDTKSYRKRMKIKFIDGIKNDIPEKRITNYKCASEKQRKKNNYKKVTVKLYDEYAVWKPDKGKEKMHVCLLCDNGLSSWVWDYNGAILCNRCHNGKGSILWNFIKI